MSLSFVGETTAGVGKTSLIIASIISILSASAFCRNAAWKSETSLWKGASFLSPHKARPRNNLGYAYFGESLHKEAISEYEKALEFIPKDPDVRYNLAMAYAAAGLKEKAREEFLLVLSIKPDDPDTLRELARITNERHR